MEELTAGSDENTQLSPAGNRTSVVGFGEKQAHAAGSF